MEPETCSVPIAFVRSFSPARLRPALHAGPGCGAATSERGIRRVLEKRDARATMGFEGHHLADRQCRSSIGVSPGATTGMDQPGTGTGGTDEGPGARHVLG